MNEKALIKNVSGATSRHLKNLSVCITIMFPVFFMFFESNDSKVEGTFLGSAVRVALPNSIAIFLCCTAIFIIAPNLGFDSVYVYKYTS